MTLQRIPNTTGNLEVLDSYTKLLITGNTVINDSTGKAVTVVGNTNISTAQSIIGGSSIYFDGSGDYLIIPYSTDFNLYSNTDFTIDFWIKTSMTDLTQFGPSGGTAAWSEEAWNIRINNTSGKIAFYCSSAGTYAYDLSLESTTNINNNTWHHVAIVRKNGNLVNLYIDGISESSQTYSRESRPINSGYPFRIAAIGTTSVTTYTNFNGYLSHFRITNSKPIWTSNFTPPSSICDYFKPVYRYNNVATTIGRSIDSYTKLLIPGNGTNGSTAITDSIGKAVTVVGNTNISTAQSIIGGSSIYFDGSGDYLTLADSDDWNFGSGDFTIDCWINSSITSGYMQIIGQYDTVFGNSSFVFCVNSNRLCFVIVNSSQTNNAINYTATSGDVCNGNNNHVCLSRSGSNYRIFLNGQQVGTTQTSSESLPNTSTILKIGKLRDDTTWYFNGYLSHIRITKGIARWTSNFTPPSKLSDYIQMNNYIGI